VVKALCLIYYVTNYATKDDVSPYQILLKAVLLKQSIAKAKATLTPNANDLRLREKDMDQFALRCVSEAPVFDLKSGLLCQQPLQSTRFTGATWYCGQAILTKGKSPRIELNLPSHNLVRVI
jgi:hypothetical protein